MLLLMLLGMAIGYRTMRLLGTPLTHRLTHEYGTLLLTAGDYGLYRLQK